MFTKVGVETKWRLLILATWATWSKRSSSIAKPPCPRNVDDAASSQSKLGTIDYKMKNTELLFWQAYILHGYGWFQTQKKPLLSDSICIRCGAEGGLEPARISTVDFESTASTDFATSALKRYAENVVNYTCRTPPCKRQLARTSLSAEIFSIAYRDV